MIIWRLLGFITDYIAFFINLRGASVTAAPGARPRRPDLRVKGQPATLPLPQLISSLRAPGEPDSILIMGK